jgi:hypothetical protein
MAFMSMFGMMHVERWTSHAPGQAIRINGWNAASGNTLGGASAARPGDDAS